ncbi:MAG: hypothetical protein HY482_01690 [Candidatus Wildermuthbacteria bacterium]|nr:hypothetical protein [Candidatus Wildermuthbacteria bacterium]
MFFSKNIPPKTTLKNLIEVPHLEQVLLWFLQNDSFFDTLTDENIKVFFIGGWGRELSDVEKLFSEEPPENQNIFRYLTIMIWREIVDVLQSMQNSKNMGLPAKEFFADKLKVLGNESDKTIGKVFEIANKYGVDPTNFNAEKDLEQFNALDATYFKTAFVKDVFLSTEIRLLAWIYQDLFNEKYSFPK